MDPADRETLQAAFAVILASIASGVLTASIVCERKWRYVWAAIIGLAGGILVRATPAGQIVAEHATGWHQWTAQPLLGVLFALGWAAIVDGLLSSQIPLIKKVRRRGRRALRASRWGTVEEIGEQVGMDPGLLHAVLPKVGVEAPEMTTARSINRIRIAAHVFAGSLVGLFFAVREFREAFLHAFTWDGILVNAIGTFFVTFFIGPLHEVVMHLRGHAPEAPTHTDEHDSRRLVRGQIAMIAVVAVLLFLLQALHESIAKVLPAMRLIDWILLLEFCALPLIVTTYYFGVALYHGDLGDHRWDRALEASVWFGAIILMPFAMGVMFSDAFPAGLRESMLNAISEPGDNTKGMIVFALLLTYFCLIVAAGMAVIASVVTYGVYAAGLGVAMVDSARNTVRRKATIFVLVAGVVVQGLTAAFLHFVKIEGVPASAYYVHLCLAAGWAVGLHLSRFERELVLPPPKQTPAAG